MFIMLVIVILKRPACALFGTTGLVPWVMTRALVGLLVKTLVTTACTPVPVKVICTM